MATSRPSAAAAQKPQDDAVASLPSIPPFGEVPVEDEVKIGRYIAGSLPCASPLVNDPAQQA